MSVAALHHHGADASLLARIDMGLRMLTVPLPHLAGLAAAVRVHLDWRVPTMGIFASGRLLVNPAFAARLKEHELIFVLAHELLHLALRTHDRARGSNRLEFNFAHDYIINDILRGELGFATIPAGGLDMPGARELSAEEIVLEMRRNADRMPTRTQVFDGAQASVRQAFGNRGGGADETDKAGDVLSDQTERKLYPADTDEQAKQKAEIARAAARGRELAEAIKASKGRGARGGNSQQAVVTSLRGRQRPAWQSALQRWIEGSSPGPRTFSRPSRRGADRSDVVLPGRERQSFMLNIVLDTSGSMTQHIPRALGAIADLCDDTGVEHIRVMQCDTAVTADDMVDPSALAAFRISGYGGSDLSPAMLALARDPHVTTTVIITDGEIDFPKTSMPYQVLWALPPGAQPFAPPYGRVIVMSER